MRDNPNIDIVRDNLGSHEDGVIERSRITSYQNAIDDLLKAVK